MDVTLPDGVRVDIAECAAHPEQTETLADLAVSYDLRRQPHTLAMVAEVLLARAKARRSDDLPGAVEDLTAGLAVAAHVPEPELSAELYAVRAQVVATLVGHRDALADYDRAVELAPDNPSYRNNRSVSRRVLGDHGGAVTDARRAVAGRTESWLYWLTLGEALASRGDLEAVAVVRHAHRMNPSIGRLLADPVFDPIRDREEFPVREVSSSAPPSDSLLAREDA
jgi:tetratricopeptide (TPR) repeat protein